MKSIGTGVIVFLIIAGIFWVSENIRFKSPGKDPELNPEEPKGENEIDPN